ncbi:MAG: four helix bundle protein [Candidatus Jettenia sp.]|uniref:Ribosomal protein n=1 Tax=Candidatus Jettenia caeni TaxID=247490 RepID=I3IP65_9BACT|nr:four helix bundle protein [Candidatus Jettenia sp. AMX1]MBC6930544.1 four helix bundle protein [Candidatus Jettenia sp.]WKZ15968.1 MAG: four helix bundle protein [Candidatus Jettenia caeni]KAA0246942.1 MAG: four helix bundle protein [Candidatus Jettenia sp. AMX1]MCE7882159.1 four helix bundle protein [Candidatus Jettenia sp. AMX1]MCQ3928677.1 four helix bundle protein [Candidatus Jettenia sp.]
MHFEDLEIWKAARVLTNKIYGITKEGAFVKDRSLRDQIRRASVSIMSNIAEGYERGGNQELIQFLSIAKGSCGEVRCQLYIAGDQRYIPLKDLNPILEQCKRISIMINNFMEHLKDSRYKGSKYKLPRQKSIKEIVDEIANRVKANPDQTTEPS